VGRFGNDPVSGGKFFSPGKFSLVLKLCAKAEAAESKYQSELSGQALNALILLGGSSYSPNLDKWGYASAHQLAPACQVPTNK